MMITICMRTTDFSVYLSFRHCLFCKAIFAARDLATPPGSDPRRFSASSKRGSLSHGAWLTVLWDRRTSSKLPLTYGVTRHVDSHPMLSCCQPLCWSSEWARTRHTDDLESGARMRHITCRSSRIGMRTSKFGGNFAKAHISPSMTSLSFQILHFLYPTLGHAGHHPPNLSSRKAVP